MSCLNNNEKKFKYNETQKTVEQKDDIKTYLSVFDVISIYKQFFVSNKITYSEKWVYFTTLFLSLVFIGHFTSHNLSLKAVFLFQEFSGCHFCPNEISYFSLFIKSDLQIYMLHCDLNMQYNIDSCQFQICTFSS